MRRASLWSAVARRRFGFGPKSKAPSSHRTPKCTLIAQRRYEWGGMSLPLSHILSLPETKTCQNRRDPQRRRPKSSHAALDKAIVSGRGCAVACVYVAVNVAPIMRGSHASFSAVWVDDIVDGSRLRFSPRKHSIALRARGPTDASRWPLRCSDPHRLAR